MSYSYQNNDGYYFQGLPGQFAERGEQGLSGLEGIAGISGRPGQKGAPGEYGPNGPKGIRGDDGQYIVGIKGIRGDEGNFFIYNKSNSIKISCVFSLHIQDLRVSWDSLERPACRVFQVSLEKLVPKVSKEK